MLIEMNAIISTQPVVCTHSERIHESQWVAVELVAIAILTLLEKTNAVAIRGIMRVVFDGRKM
jgi:hypothetical protein